MQYRRTPLETGYSPSELLNGRQMRCKIDTLLPSPVHIAQGKQAKAAAKSQSTEREVAVLSVRRTIQYKIGTPCYAEYCGPRRDKDPRWVPATVTKVLGTRSVYVRVHPRGPTWRRHIEQLRPRYGLDEDADPGEGDSTCSHVDQGDASTRHDAVPQAPSITVPMAPSVPPHVPSGPTKPIGPPVLPGGYTSDQPRRSGRLRGKQRRCHLDDCND